MESSERELLSQAIKTLFEASERAEEAAELLELEEIERPQGIENELRSISKRLEKWAQILQRQEKGKCGAALWIYSQDLAELSKTAREGAAETLGQDMKGGTYRGKWADTLEDAKAKGAKGYAYMIGRRFFVLEGKSRINVLQPIAGISAYDEAGNWLPLSDMLHFFDGEGQEGDYLPELWEGTEGQAEELAESLKASGKWPGLRIEVDKKGYKKTQIEPIKFID